MDSHLPSVFRMIAPNSQFQPCFDGVTNMGLVASAIRTFTRSRYLWFPFLRASISFLIVQHSIFVKYVSRTSGLRIWACLQTCTWTPKEMSKQVQLPRGHLSLLISSYLCWWRAAGQNERWSL